MALGHPATPPSFSLAVPFRYLPLPGEHRDENDSIVIFSRMPAILDRARQVHDEASFNYNRVRSVFIHLKADSRTSMASLIRTTFMGYDWPDDPSANYNWNITTVDGCLGEGSNALACLRPASSDTILFTLKAFWLDMGRYRCT